MHAVWASEMLLDALTIAWTDPSLSPTQVASAGEVLEAAARELQTLKTFRHHEAQRLRAALPNLLAAVGWRRAQAAQVRGADGDPKGFRRCGEQYVAIYNEFDEHKHADTLLFKAARCFEAAGLIGPTLKLRRLIVSRFPESRFGKQSLRELAENYQSLAMFRQAATRLERFAALHVKDSYAPTALSNAYIFRVGLGDDDQAIEDLQKYESLYRKKNPAKAAKIFWSRHAGLASDAETLDHAREYLKVYGDRGGVDRRAVAEATIGQILWRQSCGRALLHDSCITIKRVSSVSSKSVSPRRCDGGSGEMITVHPRNSRRADEAQRHFAAVLSVAAQEPRIPESDVARRAEFHEAVGLAMVYAVDKDYEAYLKLKIPSGLEFYVDTSKRESDRKTYLAQLAKREASQRRFSEFIGQKTAQGQDLIARYAAVKTAKSPHWLLAAAARTGILAENFANQLHRADVPRRIVSKRQYRAYCDALGEASAAPLALAHDAYVYCLERSTEMAYFNEFSRACEEALHRTDPEHYPATHEILGHASHTRVVMDVVGVQRSPVLPDGIDG